MSADLLADAAFDTVFDALGVAATWRPASTGSALPITVLRSGALVLPVLRRRLAVPRRRDRPRLHSAPSGLRLLNGTTKEALDG